MFEEIYIIVIMIPIYYAISYFVLHKILRLVLLQMDDVITI
jgi:hypothetical protein